MQQSTLTIVNKLGLHARAAMKLVDTASRYSSETKIRFNDREINAKSIMNVLVIGATYGSEIEVMVSGEDETEAFQAIQKLINDRFGESE